MSKIVPLKQAAALSRDNQSVRIARVRTAEDLATTADLFRAYAEALGVDLSYQGFEEEMTALPGEYAPPPGELLLARAGAGEPVGCVALRPIEPGGTCEMKRLYVTPQGRGSGLGERLAKAAIETARQIGYREMRLDTLPFMVGAQFLYRKLGFREIEPYYESPVAGTRFMGRAL